LIADEVQTYVKRNPVFKGSKGSFDVTTSMAQLTIFTASRSLQGKEVRDKFDESFADLYHDLDQGFTPYNFLLPWFPFPHNRRRDIAHQKMVDTYTSIIRKRRAQDSENTEHSQDMIWNLMQCVYKNGNQIPEHEIAHMMIALLMAGQHSSSSTITWILLNLANRPEITEELIAEQKAVLGDHLPPLTYEDLPKLPLHAQVVKETLRMHAPIHSIMRKVKTTMPVEGTSMIVPDTHTLMASPIYCAMSPEYFPNPTRWEPHRWDQDSSGVALPEMKDEEKIDYGYGLVTKGASSPYLPFGAGRHRCIGEQFAYVQLQVILIMFIREFKLTNLPGRTGVVAPDYSVSFHKTLQANNC
jgi:cytochrome P450